MAFAGRDVDAFFVDRHSNERGSTLAARLIATALAVN
jgi:hypothetical protein